LWGDIKGKKKNRRKNKGLNGNGDSLIASREGGAEETRFLPHEKKKVSPAFGKRAKHAEMRGQNEGLVGCVV